MLRGGLRERLLNLEQPISVLAGKVSEAGIAL